MVPQRAVTPPRCTVLVQVCSGLDGGPPAKRRPALTNSGNLQGSELTGECPGMSKGDSRGWCPWHIRYGLATFADLNAYSLKNHPQQQKKTTHPCPGGSRVSPPVPVKTRLLVVTWNFPSFQLCPLGYWPAGCSTPALPGHFREARRDQELVCACTQTARVARLLAAPRATEAILNLLFLGFVTLRKASTSCRCHKPTWPFL